MCPDQKADHANIINSVETCNHLSKMVEDGEQKPGTLSLISLTQPNLGVVMSYEGGNMCNETSKYSLQVQLNCNPNLEKTTYALDKDSLNSPCDPRVIMNSPHACPVLTTGPLGLVLSDYAYWFGVPLILIGGYLAFVGGKFPAVTLFIFSAFAVSLSLLFSIYLLFMPSFTPTWTVPIIFLICLGMGLGMGYGAAKWKEIGIVIMGFSLGSLLGFLVYKAFLEGTVDSQMSKIITIFGVAILSSILYFTLQDYMIIITSAIFGSYIFIRVSIFLTTIE